MLSSERMRQWCARVMCFVFFVVVFVRERCEGRVEREWGVLCGGDVDFASLCFVFVMVACLVSPAFV